MTGVTLITPTGCRPQALDLCTGFVARQTWAGPAQWLLVDDGEPVSPIDAKRLPANIELQTVYPKPSWQPGQNTLARNLLAAIPLVRHPFVLFIEDDDWLAPDYVEAQMAQLLEGADIVGEARARYYHIRTAQYWVLPFSNHASLCRTGVSSTVLPLLQRICLKPDAAFIDVQLWEQVGTKKVLYDGGRSVGIKGLPGRPGIGIGHRPQACSGHWRQDLNFLVLENWVGAEDAVSYRSFAGKKL